MPWSVVKKFLLEQTNKRLICLLIFDFYYFFQRQFFFFWKLRFSSFLYSTLLYQVDARYIYDYIFGIFIIKLLCYGYFVDGTFAASFFFVAIDHFSQLEQGRRFSLLRGFGNSVYLYNIFLVGCFDGWRYPLFGCQTFSVTVVYRHLCFEDYLGGYRYLKNSTEWLWSLKC